MKKRLAALVLSGALAFGTVVACDVTETGSDKPGQEVSGDRETKPDTSDPDGLFSDGFKDVTLKSCKLQDPFPGDGMDDPDVVVADLSYTNSSDKVSDYSVEVEVLSPSGSRVESLYAFTDKVSPGQTVDTGSGAYDEENATGSEDKAPKGSFSCKIISADRMATVN